MKNELQQLTVGNMIVKKRKIAMGGVMADVVEVLITNAKIFKTTIDRVHCSRYEGKFSCSILNAKAETGLWYTSVSGNPFAIEGEGVTLQKAIQDSISRTKNRIEDMQKGLTCLIECDKLLSTIKSNQ